MSKLFYDHLIVFEEIEKVIKKTSSTKEEKEELWILVDEVINHKVMEKILDKLPKEHHVEFLELFHKCPHDEITIFGYLKEKTGKDIETVLKKELSEISKELLETISAAHK